MIEIKELPKSQLEVRVTLPSKEWEIHIQPAVERFAQTLTVEGFRPGKAPRDIVEKHVGIEQILSEAADRAIQKSWPKVVEEKKLEVIGRPQADIGKLSEGKDLEYVITTSVMPKVELKKDWKKKVQKAKEKKARELEKSKVETSVEEEVEKEIKRIAESRAKLVTVERSSKKGDSVTLDFQVSIGGVPIEGGTAKNHSIVLGSNTFIPGFEDEVTGLAQGEKKVFELKFPKEYHDKNIAGKKAMFDIEVKTVQEREIPECDDAFAKSLGNFETLEDIKKNIREGIVKEREEKILQEKRTALIESLLPSISVDLPDVLVDQEMDVILYDYEQRVTSMGMPFDQYLTQMKKTKEEMKESFREPATKRVLVNLGFSEIAQEEEIEPNSEDIQARMNQVLSRYGDVKDIEKKIDMQKLYVVSRGEIINEKVWEVLDSLQ